MDYIWGSCKKYSKSGTLFQEDEISPPVYFSCLKKIFIEIAKEIKKIFLKKQTIVLMEDVKDITDAPKHWGISGRDTQEEIKLMV